MSWKYSKTFSPPKCLSRKPSVSWKYSKTFSAAKMSQQQPIKVLKIFKDSSACKIVLAANQRYPGNIRRFFRLQNFRSRKSAISWKHSKISSPANLSQPQIIDILEIFKDFFACKNVLAANHLYPGNIQRLFRLQKCLSRKPSVSWKYSKTFSAAKMSQQQPIKVLKIFKDSSACKIVLAANQRYPGNIRRFFRLQNFRSRKSAISWKHSKISSPANLSQPQIIDILEIFKDFFACKNVLAANHLYPGNIQRLFRLQKCLSSNPSKFSKFSKTLPPAKLSQPQISDILETFEDFFACKIFVAANQRYPGNIQRFFRLQKCLSRKPSVSWNFSKTFSPAKLSQPQISDILETFKEFSAFKIVLAATHQYSEKFQRLFCLQNCLSRKSSISWKYSKTFSPAKMSQPQTICILEIFKDFFGCKNVLAANHLYPGNIQRLFRLQKCLSSNPSKFSKFSKTLPPAKLSQPQISDILETFEDFFACKIFVAANQRYPGNNQRFLRLQTCLSRKSSISWKYSKTFSPAKMSQPQTICILEIFKDFFGCKNVLVATHQSSQNFQRLFLLQNCLSRKSAISWKHSKIFSPAKFSQPQISDILETFKDFSACKNVLAANHLYPGIFQRLFRLQNCLSRKSAIYWKHPKSFPPSKLSQQQPINILKSFKDFFACKIVLAANHRYPGNIQRLFRLQKCLSRKPSVSWKYSKTYSAAKMSQQQPIKVLKIFKDSSACKIVLAANQRYPGNIRRFSRLQNFRSRKSAISWKHSKISSPANLSQPQIIDILEIFKDFFTCKNVLAANHLYPGNIQRLFRLQKCLSRKPSVSWKYSKTFSAAKMSQQQPIKVLKIFKDSSACKIVLAANQRYPGNIRRFFRLQNFRSRKSAISWKHSKTSSPANLSQPQIIDILEIFKDFFACKNVLAANHLYPGNIQRLFRLQKCLSSNPSKFSKFSKTLPPAKLSQPQISDILETFEDFFACKIFVAANQRYPGNIQRFFRLQKCLSRKPSVSWNFSKTFSPAKLSQPQIIDILEIYKDLFACKKFLAATHHYSEKIQRPFRLQNCLSRKSSISWKYSKIFPPAKMSQPQTICILEFFKDFFACKIVSAANQRYTGNIQRVFRLQNCLSSNPSIF